METLYKRNSDGTYEPASVGFYNDLPDGIWIIQTKKSSKGYTSAAYMAGKIQDPCDLITLASIQSMSDEISQFLIRLTEEDSEEWQDAKETLGGYLQGPVSFYNISPNDLGTLVLRQVAKRIGENFPEKSRMIW
jgi:hypothetical protein